MEKNDQDYFDKLYDQSEADMKQDADEWAKNLPDAPAGRQRIDNFPNRDVKWWRTETDKIAGIQRDETNE